MSAAPDLIEIYTDGACTGNPGPAGCGAVLIHKGRVKELSTYLGEATNNIAELTAVEIALQALRTTRLPVRIHADSTYAIGVLSGTLKVRANVALVARIRALLDRFADVRFAKVRGHAGVAHNVRADALARQAIRAAAAARAPAASAFTGSGDSRGKEDTDAGLTGQRAHIAASAGGRHGSWASARQRGRAAPARHSESPEPGRRGAVASAGQIGYTM